MGTGFFTANRSEADIPDVAFLARLHVDAVDEADAMRMRLHDERRRPDAVAEEADALHDRAISDARRGKDDVLPRRQILRAIDPLEIGNTHRTAPFLVLGSADDEPGEDLSAKTAHRGGGDDAFRRAAGAHHRVDAAAEHGGCDTSGEVAVADQADAGACLADLFNQLRVTGPIEHDDDQVLHPSSKRL